ncbi:hypothetical protein LCGC14_0767930 [marine sediment metagenome]|uniref:Uncharacterized protein n=1 Tax=marine sediment metagenome TaxID=412755 RepID=A0A0F9QIY7_9ZZZZ
MAYDECADCEAPHPEGKGLKDGICKGCQTARREMRKSAEETAEPEADPGEE